MVELDFLLIQQASTESHLGGKKRRNGKKPLKASSLRKESAFLASRIILLSRQSYIHSCTHCTGPLVLEQNSALQPAALSSLGILPEWHKGVVQTSGPCLPDH